MDRWPENSLTMNPQWWDRRNTFSSGDPTQSVEGETVDTLVVVGHGVDVVSNELAGRRLRR